MSDLSTNTVVSYVPVPRAEKLILRVEGSPLPGQTIFWSLVHASLYRLSLSRRVGWCSCGRPLHKVAVSSQLGPLPSTWRGAVLGPFCPFCTHPCFLAISDSLLLLSSGCNPLPFVRLRSYFLLPYICPSPTSMAVVDNSLLFPFCPLTRSPNDSKFAMKSFHPDLVKWVPGTRNKVSPISVT